MKNTILIVIAIVSTNISIAQNEKVTYKKIALDILSESLSELESTVKDLSDTELKYTPKNGGWTVLNCLEHLAFTEPRLGGGIKKRVKENNVDLNKDLSANDWLVISKVTDRTNKVTTPPPFRPQPEMKDKTREYFLTQIKKDRKDLIDFIKTTDANLRHIFGPYPYGEADMIQQALVAGAHMYRHTMQIREILEEQKVNN